MPTGADRHKIKMKKKMKITKRTAMSLGICGLIAIMGITGTIAYLTDKAGATNKFTFGEVKVELLEPDWDTTDTDGDGIPDMSEFVVPNQPVPKSVEGHNVGINDAVVFIKLTVPVHKVTRVADNGTAERKENNYLDAKMQELFYFQQKEDTINCENNHFADTWINLPEEEMGYEGAGGSTPYLDLTNTKVYTDSIRTYVFGFHRRIPKDEYTTKLFEKVQIKNIIENEVDPADVQDIKVELYSIQADCIVDENGEIDTSGELDHDTLKEIYDIYMTQNPRYKNETEDDDMISTEPEEAINTKTKVEKITKKPASNTKIEITESSETESTTENNDLGPAIIKDENGYYHSFDQNGKETIWKADED